MDKARRRLMLDRYRQVPKHWVSPVAAYTVPEVTQAYNYPVDFTGRGQRVAVILPGGGLRQDDLDVYFETLRLRKPSIEVIEVGGAKNEPCSRDDLRRFLLAIGGGYEGKPRAPYSDERKGSPAFPPDMEPGSELFIQVTWTFEAIVDVEIIGASAPGAEIRVYVCTTGSRSIGQAIDAAIEDGCSVMNGSWGWPELLVVDGDYMTKVDQAFGRARAKGVTCCFASGDTGARPDFAEGDDSLAAMFPASSPNVLACGGTKIVALEANGRPREVVWNEADFTFDGSSGGGFSAHFARPEWQRNLGPVGDSQKGRAVPDVAANSAASSGMWLWIAGLNAVSFGTSAASPLFAGLVARLTEAAGGTPRFLPTLFYKESIRSRFQDITVGSSAKEGYGPEYPATEGWDPCTGLGTPNGEALLTALTDQQQKDPKEQPMSKYVKDDLLIASEDGKIYYIPSKDWKRAEVDDNEAKWLTEELLSRGVTLAAIPENAAKSDDDDGPGGGALIACYLVNISGLRQKNPFEKK